MNVPFDNSVYRLLSCPLFLPPFFPSFLLPNLFYPPSLPSFLPSLPTFLPPSLPSFLLPYLPSLLTFLSPSPPFFLPFVPSSLQSSIKFLRRNLREIVPTTDGNITFSLLKIMDCFFKPFVPKEVCVCVCECVCV